MLAIDNHYESGEKRPKLSSHLHIIHEPNDAWNYAHHPFLAFFQGKFYLTFSLGRYREDDVGQKVMITESEDFVHWTAPRELAVPSETHATLIASGHWVSDTHITQYALQFTYTEDVLVDGHRKSGNKGRVHWHFRVFTSLDGTHYEECESIPITNFGGNMPVRKLPDGRLFSCGGQHAGWTWDPDGITGWTGAEVFPDGFHSPEERAEDHPLLPGEVSNAHIDLCEGSTLDYDDGSMLMLLRSGTSTLWGSLSQDHGAHWSLPEPTSFTDNRTKFFLGRLPDGRYYHIGTPDPFPPRTRHVLALSLSEDGKDFHEHYLLEDRQFKGRYPGLDKNGIYGYPTCLIQDNTLYVTCSINKEMIAVMHFDLQDLAK